MRVEAKGGVILASLALCALSACASGNDTASVYEPPAQTHQTPGPDATVPSTYYGMDATTPPTGDATLPPDNDAGSGLDGGDDGGDSGGDSGVPCTPGEVCVDVTPSGWSGYVQLRMGGGDAGAGCLAPYGSVQQNGVADPPAGAPAQCAACTCTGGDAGTAIVCAVNMDTQNLGCLGASPTSTQVPQDTCTPIMGANGAVSSASVINGSCASQGGQVVAVPDAGSAPSAVVCAPGGADAGAGVADASADAGATADAAAPDSGLAIPVCMSTQVCVPPASSASGPSGLCIFQAGIMPCPAGTIFTQQHLVGASVADTRGCGCACAPPTCPTDGFVDGFKNGGCTGAPAATFQEGAACSL
ncbi:MAG: hypothetical protein ACREJ3_16960, partial [Polyangiaceae bacterium]